MTKANRAFEGAFRKGREARLRGDPPESCPYRDTRKWDGRLTFSRAFRRAWHDGYESVELATSEKDRQQ